MDILTLVVVGAVLLLVGAVLLLVGVFTVRKLKARTAIAPTQATPSISPPPARASRLPPADVTPVAAGAMEVEWLRLKLLNCFGGNDGAMSRSITFERKKFSHLSEAELLKKMLYDFERGH